jgi:anti-sigma regulatory factor (Ser/Thr protein kinase)
VLGGQTTLILVAEASQVGEARRAVAVACDRLDFDEAAAGAAALVATEAATNLVKHAGGGQILIRGAEDWLEVMALDRGPGIADIGASMRDGSSTAGTAGTGLGAIRRMATTFDIFSIRGAGTALLARVRRRSSTTTAGRIEVGAVSIPKTGETLNGDAWTSRSTPRGCRILVVDGLGHGPVANEAARGAVDAFDATPRRGAVEEVEACHDALRSTRGAALAVADVDLDGRMVRFAGVGNIAGSVWDGSTSHHMVSLNGTAGHGTIHAREFSYGWPARGILVLSSDGLTTRWSLESYPGLAARDPALVAGVLYRDHTRGHDDVTVVVAREARA